MTLKNNRAPLLCNCKFAHHFIAIGQIDSNMSYNLDTHNSGPNRRSLSHVTLKFDKWPWIKIGYFLYATSSFVHHFVAIYKFKLESQSRNTKFRSKSVIFLSRVTSKFYGWLRKRTGHLFYTSSSFMHHCVVICEFKLELQSGNSQIRTKFVLTSLTLTFDSDLLNGHHFCQW